jgi:hypothetical protein
MSEEAINEVIRRALVDDEFRSQLFSDPEAALSGYDLTEEERASLSAMQEQAFDAFASEIEERISRSTAGLRVPLRPKRIVEWDPNDLNQLLGR